MKRIPMLPWDICLVAVILALNMGYLLAGIFTMALSVPAIVMVGSGLYISQRMDGI